MKTTVDIPDITLRQVKTIAAARGVTMKSIIGQALDEWVQRAAPAHRKPVAEGSDPPWMEGFGELAHLGDEHKRVRALIEDAFEEIEPEDAR